MATHKTHCDKHGHHVETCKDCRRFAVIALVVRENELREFRRLMCAPQRVR